MVPLRRKVTAKTSNQEILNAVWSNGNTAFAAKIANEGLQIFACRWKEQ